MVLLSLVVRRTRAWMANKTNTTSALTMRMSCSHLTTTCDMLVVVLVLVKHGTDGFVACDGRV
jgi:hypothetical protein